MIENAIRSFIFVIVVIVVDLTLRQWYCSAYLCEMVAYLVSH